MLFLGGGATIARTPLLDIFSFGDNIPVNLLEMLYLQGHLDDGDNKNGTLVYIRVLEHMKN